MTYKLFIDDEREPVNSDWIVVRSFDEAVEAVRINGFPMYVSFDHDLGENIETGYDFAKWLIEQDMDFEWWFHENSFGWNVHSQNPIGKENINSLLKNYKREKFE